jgi:hypothetical protein
MSTRAAIHTAATLGRRAMIALMAACAVAATVHTQAQSVDAPARVHAAR